MIKAGVCAERLQLYTGLLKDVHEVLGYLLCWFHRKTVTFLTSKLHMRGLDCTINNEFTYIDCFGGSDAFVDTYVHRYASRVPMWCWAASWLPSLRGCTRGTWWG